MTDRSRETSGNERPHNLKLRGYGIYVLKHAYLWHLERVVPTKIDAQIAAHVNEKFETETLIAGPWSRFPEWIES